MAKKSQQPNSVLRSRKVIQEDMNKAVFELGNMIANVHLIHKQKGELLLKIERLSKEVPAPEEAPAQSPKV